MKSKKSAAEITLAAIENAHAIALIEKEFIECPWSENQIAESILSPGYTFFLLNTHRGCRRTDW